MTGLSCAECGVVVPGSIQIKTARHRHRRRYCLPADRDDPGR